MKKRFLAVMCSLLIVTLTGCASIDEFVNPVTEEPEPTVSVEHNYAYNGPESTADELEEEEPVEEAEPENEEPEEEKKDPYPFVGTLVAPEGFEEYKYGSYALNNVYLAVKYASLYEKCYDDVFAPLETTDPEQFKQNLDSYFTHDLQECVDSALSNEDENVVYSGLDQFNLDENNKIIVDDEMRDSYIGIGLGWFVLSEEELEGVKDGSIIIDGRLNEYADLIDTYCGIDWENDDFEREHAKDVVVDGVDYKLWTVVTSFGTDSENNTARGKISYVFYTIDGSDNTLDFDNMTYEYVGDLSNLELNGIATVHTSSMKSDTYVVEVQYRINDVVGDEVVFQNDIVLYDSDGKLIE